VLILNGPLREFGIIKVSGTRVGGAREQEEHARGIRQGVDKRRLLEDGGLLGQRDKGGVKTGVLTACGISGERRERDGR